MIVFLCCSFNSIKNSNHSTFCPNRRFSQIFLVCSFSFFFSSFLFLPFRLSHTPYIIILSIFLPFISSSVFFSLFSSSLHVSFLISILNNYLLFLSSSLSFRLFFSRLSHTLHIFILPISLTVISTTLSFSLFSSSLQVSLILSTFPSSLSPLFSVSLCLRIGWALFHYVIVISRSFSCKQFYKLKKNC